MAPHFARPTPNPDGRTPTKNVQFCRTCHRRIVRRGKHLASDGVRGQWRHEADRLGNQFAEEGCDRCTCGCKYWENDRCVDCGTQFVPGMRVPEHR